MQLVERKLKLFSTFVDISTYRELVKISTFVGQKKILQIMKQKTFSVSCCLRYNNEK